MLVMKDRKVETCHCDCFRYRFDVCHGNDDPALDEDSLYQDYEPSNLPFGMDFHRNNHLPSLPLRMLYVGLDFSNEL